MISMAQPPSIATRVSQAAAANYDYGNINKKIKRKRVTWAPDNELRQVRFFCAEDSPSLAGYNGNKGKPELSKGKSLPDLPPGFGPEDIKSSRLKSAAMATIVPQVLWRIPDLITLNPEWRVVAGGGSEEVLNQQEREKRSFEAFYPRPSSIPENPAEPPETQEVDDNLTPIIPTTPIEELETQTENVSGFDSSPGSTSSSASLVTSTSFSSSTASLSQLSNVNGGEVNESSLNASLPEFKPGMVSVIRENGSIDQKVLKNILSNDNLIMAASRFKGLPNNDSSAHQNEKLPAVNDKPGPHVAISHKSTSMHFHRALEEDHGTSGNMPPGFFSLRMDHPNHGYPVNNLHPHVNHQMHAHPHLQPHHTLPFNDRGFTADDARPANEFIDDAMLSRRASFPMDPKLRHNAHDGNGRVMYHAYNGDSGLVESPHFDSNRDNNNGPNVRTNAGKKLCAFFNSPRGCRNGSNCTFLHEIGEVRASKKRDRNSFDNSSKKNMK